MKKSSIYFDMQRLKQATALVDEAVQRRAHPNGLLAVATSSETVLTHVVAKDDPISANSIFLLASITKPMVGTAIMQLVESGRLLLNIPVANYIPEFDAHGKDQVTTWHLLTHTSGLEEVRWWEELTGQQNATSQDFVAAACRSYLHFQPGTRCEYCSLSFAILGELITRISGTPYPDYLREAIFAPLGMSDTAFQPVDRARAVPVYDFGGPEQVERFSSIAAPGGGMWSTAADLIHFGQTFLAGGRRKNFRLLGPAAIDAMTRNHTPGMTEMQEGREVPFNYGLGWGKAALDGSLISSPAAYGHGGATGTYFWVDPEWDMVFVFLTNRWGIEHDTPRRILNAVYGALDVA